MAQDYITLWTTILNREWLEKIVGTAVTVDVPSGEGADPNVTGRGFMHGFEDDFHCKKMMIRGLTEQSHHNASCTSVKDMLR